MLSQLQLDLRELSQEARKREPELKEASENASLLLRNLAEKHPDMSDQLRGTTSRKWLALISSLVAINEALAKLSEVIASIAQPVDTGVISDMTFLLKVMQTVVAILTPPSPPMHQDDLARALGVCFQLKLRAVRLPGLHQPAEASLRQIFSTILDRTWDLYSARLSSASAPQDAKEVKEPAKDKSSASERPKPSECDLCILDATRLLRDIVYLAGGEQAVWLSLTTLDPNFCLELLEEFLTAHRQLALKCPEFTSIVKDRISALLLALLEHRRDIGFMIRLLRNCVAFLASFHMLQPMHCVTILTSFRSLLVPATQPFWVQVLMLETFRWLCKDSDSLLHKIVLEDDGLLRDKPQLLEAFIKFIGKLGRYVTTTIAKFEASEFVTKVTKPRFIDQLTYLDISNQMTPSHAITLALSSFVSFTDTMAHLIAPFDTQTNAPLISSSSSSPALSRASSKSDHLATPSSSALSSTMDKSSIAHSETVYRANQKICDSSWPSVLASLSVVLSKTRDESLIQSSLKAYQSFTNTLGVLKLSGPRGAFLDSLVKFSLPFSLGPQQLPVSPPSPTITSAPGSSAGHSELPATGPLAAPFPFSLLAEEQYKNCRFTKKNIAAMKTVLNVAHCMGSILDSSWNTMVETLNHLNGILACTRRVRNVSVIMSSSSASSFSSTGSAVGSPMDDDMSDSSLSSSTASRTRPMSPAVSQYELNTQDSSLSAQDWPTREEIDILDSALDSLFTTSVYISDSGFIDFALALISLSLAQFGAIGENLVVKPFHLFGFTSLMKLLRHNARRASLVWTSVHQHVLFACNFPNGGARQLSVRAICGTIEDGVATISRPPYETMSHDDPVYVALMLMQVRYLETMEALVEARHEQTRVEILDSLHRVLQHSGSALSTGWPVVLAILLNIGVSNEISLIPLGFKSVQAITNEYLSALPYDCLPVTISTIGNFGGKSIADININIAAIGLLWNVADFIARKQADILSESRKSQASASSASGEASSTGPSAGTGDGSDKAEQQVADTKTPPTYVDSLWLALFQELAARVDNQRSEIRDCALATLYGILTTYGASLNISAWQTLLERHLLPSLPWVLKQVQLATREPDDKDAHQAMTATTNLGPSQPSNPSLVPSSTLNNSHSSPHLSSSNASSANIVIHHSRNTLGKQWQETQVGLLANLSRVFKAFLRTTLVKFSPAFFEKLYSIILDHVELFAKNASLEVAVQCVSAIRDILIAVYAGVDTFVLEQGFDASGALAMTPAIIGLESHAWRTWQRIANHIGATRTHARLVGHFMDAIEEIFNMLVKKQCDTPRIERLISVVQPLLYLPLELAGEYTVLHKQVFPILASFSLPSGPHARYSLALLPKLVSICLTYISNAIGYRYHSACYCPRSPEICYQLDEPIPAADDLPSNVTPRSHNLRGSKNSFVSDRGSWNVNPASLEKNFFNLADKSINLLQQIWDGLATNEYASKCENMISAASFEGFDGQVSQADSASPTAAFLSAEQIQVISQQISLQIFPDIISVLGHAIQAKPLDARAKFWAPSLDLFMKSIRGTLSKLTPGSLISGSPSAEALAAQPKLESSEVVEPEKIVLPSPSASPSRALFTNIEINIIWTGIIDSIESFLMLGAGASAETSPPPSGYGSHYMSTIPTTHMSSYGSGASMGMSPSVSSEAVAMSAAVSEARLVELLSSHLLYICPSLPNLHDRLFQILIDGCEMVHREALMKQCYSSLFDAVHSTSSDSDADSTNDDKRSTRTKVGKLAVPQLMKRCKIVLAKFVADDKRSGALPLPSARVVEITYLLEQLKILRIDPSYWDKPAKTLSDSPRRHLWDLFPLLCECITAKEVELKAVIKSVFLECGHELGLE